MAREGVRVDRAGDLGEAIRKGIARASKTLDKIQGAWIKEQSVVVKGKDVAEYRVNMKVTFVLKD